MGVDENATVLFLIGPALFVSLHFITLPLAAHAQL